MPESLASGSGSHEDGLLAPGSRLARRADHPLPALPAAGGPPRGGGRGPAAALPRAGVLGAPAPGVRRSARAGAPVGLAPAAHGGNRTGRMFTGDRSGDWLFPALHEAGFANQPTSIHAGDGLRLDGAYITATIRCAPPANKPPPVETRTAGRSCSRSSGCSPGCGWWSRSARSAGTPISARDASWGSGCRGRCPGSATGPAPPMPGDGVTLLGSFHPSQQNTFTGKLTRPMLRAVFTQARRLADR